MAKAPVLDVEGVDDMLGLSPQGPVQMMGITPQNQPKPAFTLTRMPPRERMTTVMEPQYEASDEEGKRGKLVGFRPVQKSERIEGGFMLRAMKGHSVFIASYDELAARGLASYVPLLSENSFDGPVATLPVAAYTTGSHKAA